MTVEMMVPPHKLGDFADLLAMHELKADLMIENLQE